MKAWGAQPYEADSISPVTVASRGSAAPSRDRANLPRDCPEVVAPESAPSWLPDCLPLRGRAGIRGNECRRWWELGEDWDPGGLRSHGAIMQSGVGLWNVQILCLGRGLQDSRTEPAFRVR